jgi:poly-gamma-glutamate synthesis protein (capsule biosynthesis protein)
MSNAVLGFVGDVFVNRANPQEIFSDIREVLSAPDILFGNLEGVYSNEARRAPGATSFLTGPSNCLDVYANVGFDVMSLANNHIVDAGHGVLLENRRRLLAQGVSVCGAGETLKQARAPALREANGLRVAYLAYASTFPIGYEALADRPGLAPMRAYNSMQWPFTGLHAPGMFPLVTTVPDSGDLSNLAEDIARAREVADIVITSFHWGDYTCRYYLTDHETRTARYCIDQGADMVVGHHHHVLRGMEWYKGRPILYGMGHFVFDTQLKWDAAQMRTALYRMERFSGQFFDQTAWRDGWWPFPLADDGYLTGVTWAIAGKEGIRDVGFLPCRLSDDGVVHPLRSGTPEASEVIQYLAACITTQQLDGRLVTDDALAIGGFNAARLVPK